MNSSRSHSDCVHRSKAHWQGTARSLPKHPGRRMTCRIAYYNDNRVPFLQGSLLQGFRIPAVPNFRRTAATSDQKGPRPLLSFQPCECGISEDKAHPTLVLLQGTAQEVGFRKLLNCGCGQRLGNTGSVYLGEACATAMGSRKSSVNSPYETLTGVSPGLSATSSTDPALRPRAPSASSLSANSRTRSASSIHPNDFWFPAVALGLSPSNPSPAVTTTEVSLGAAKLAVSSFFASPLATVSRKSDARFLRSSASPSNSNIGWKSLGR